MTVRPGGDAIDVPVEVKGDTVYGDDAEHDIAVKAVHHAVVGKYRGGLIVENDDPEPVITLSPVADRVTEHRRRLLVLGGRRGSAVQPGDRALYHPTEDAQARAVFNASFGDDRADAALPQQAAVLVGVVAAVGEECVGPASGPADNAGHSGDLVQQRQELGDVVAVPAGQRHRERDALAVGEDVVLAARPCAVDRAGPAFGPLRAALTWEESITARDQSSLFAARSFFSSTRCSLSHTPASFHAARRRQHVIPDPKPSSCGRYSHWIPVCSTNRIPHNACRSGTRGRPSTSFGPGSGNNGSISDHSSSDTIHGRDCRFPTTRPTTTHTESHLINNFC